VKIRYLLCSMWLLGACSSHAVRCDQRLQPINVPATIPAAVRDAAPSRGSP